MLQLVNKWSFDSIKMRHGIRMWKLWKGTFEIHTARGISRFPERLPACQEVFFCMEKGDTHCVRGVTGIRNVWVVCAARQEYTANLLLYIWYRRFAGLRQLVNNLHTSHVLETRPNLTPHDSILLYYTDPAEGQESSLISTAQRACTSVHVLTWDLRSSGILRSV